MSPQTTPGLHVDVGGTTELAFKLAVAGIKETITVSGEPPLVESQPSGLSALIDERAINELPLNGRRYTDLALLTPGVTQDPRGLTSGSFGGIRGFQSSYLVDGGDNNNAFFGHARGRYRAPYQPKKARASPISGSASCFHVSSRPSPFIATMSGWDCFSIIGRPPA
jgi:hypothetical protein